MAYVEEFTTTVRLRRSGAQTPARNAQLERPARETLRAQIARLERQLGDAFSSAPTAFAPGGAASAVAGPRVLAVGELELVRDGLLTRLRESRTALGERAERESRRRELLERARLDPSRHRYLRIACSEVGQSGCGEWSVRPRLGLIGMLAGWWHVKLSSGCPLAG